MKFRVPPNALPPLTLTPEEKTELVDEATAVINETIRIEAQFRAEGCVLSANEWKIIKSRDDFHVYRERKARRAAVAAQRSDPVMRDDSVTTTYLESDNQPEWNSSRGGGGGGGGGGSSRGAMSSRGRKWEMPSMDEDSVVASMKEPHVPMLLASGVVSGRLEDNILGAFAGDDRSWRLRTYYVNDKFADARILTTIKSPTAETPFDYLGIKWFTKIQPKLVGSFLARRDFLILEATGQGVDEHGQPYGYYMIHSVVLPGAPPLSELNVIRCKVSLCFISRQISTDKIHIFARGFSDPRGQILESVAAAITAESIVSSIDSLECAYARKLTFLMQQTKRARQLRHQSVASRQGALDKCESCHKKPSVFRGGSGGLTSCQGCGLVVCSKCRIHRQILLDISSDGTNHDRSLQFCFACAIQAKKLSARDVAIATMVPTAAPRPSQPLRQTETRPSARISATLTPPPKPTVSFPSHHDVDEDDPTSWSYNSLPASVGMSSMPSAMDGGNGSLRSHRGASIRLY
ncbi:hypothetical protein Poli38472_012612 [Pythium oligandrum]|uniref:FYVE-type domain-containing protein n=1 Tax=Pythium oligandrum TaxID=41045 RepID=A0A8K1CEK1_PYTOL|nr:hypothetical protein Poli38472_012612 [Pythium oligandrum]|eukprot:TMW61421.1 hypothetical protein Poli38472_012612 [Pythium oligandrum]